MTGANETSTSAQNGESQRSYVSFGDVMIKVRHSRLLSPLRRSIHGLRDALRVVRRRQWYRPESIRRSGKTAYVLHDTKFTTFDRLRNFAHSVRDRNRELRRRRKNRKASVALSNLSDGNFILVIAELLFQGRGANPVDLDQFKRYLKEDPQRRSELIERLLCEHFIRLEHGENHIHDPHSVMIMGTQQFLTKGMWEEKAAAIGSHSPSRKEKHSAELATREFRHKGEYVVTAIASLYKGRQYLEAFLENITAQTIFDKSELIIIDANSPEGEGDLIAEYQKFFPNIIYKRINHRIGIYDAWNDAIEIARGRYITNTNLDDLRRIDSFELQAGALDELKFVDVVYQDFFYSLDSSLDFDEVARFGYKSSLPVLCVNNLLRFNSPHNAPMWRAQLHKDLGLFDTSFKSAGDYEFWLRCALHKKQFYKLNSPHVVYFQNPDGISTGPQTKGVVEARRLMNMYARKLIAPHMKMSRAEFARDLGIEPTWSWDTSLYDVVQGELARLNDRIR